MSRSHLPLHLELGLGRLPQFDHRLVVPLVLHAPATSHKHPVDGVDLQWVESVGVLSLLHGRLPTHHVPTQKVALSVGKQAVVDPKTATSIDAHELLDRLGLVGPVRPQIHLSYDRVVAPPVPKPEGTVASSVHLSLHSPHNYLLSKGLHSLLEPFTHQRVRIGKHPYKSNQP